MMVKATEVDKPLSTQTAGLPAAGTGAQSAVLEQAKQQIDYVKHISTLSTGCIVLLATLLDKVFSTPSWKPLIMLSFICFMVSVVAAVFFQSLSVITPDYFRDDKLSERTGTILSISMVVMWGFFLLGIISFTLFAVINFALK